MKSNTTTFWCRRGTPLGTVRIAARGGALVGIWFDGQKYDATRHEQSLKAHGSWAQAQLDAVLQATPATL